MTTPQIPDDAKEDVPPDQPQAPLERFPNPEDEHRRDMDRSKLKFAFWLVGSSLAVLIGLEVLESYGPLPVEGQTLSGASDTFKLIATTALGFIFGRTLGRGES